MLRFIYFVFFTCLLSACTTLESLKPVGKQQFFDLDKDYLRYQVRGITNFKYLEGLRAGRYVSVGEDDDGVYFLGGEDSVILLRDERTEKYQQTGVIAPWAERCRVQGPICGGTGGIWLPKPGKLLEPKLFYLLKPIDRLNDYLPGTPGWLTRGVIASMAQDSFNYIYFGSERDFLASLKIRDWVQQ